jgi:bifunctional DNA-binding transcriptional regulator/antitoxin component of YhaV-PrlF toxin-antitoxin module
VLFRSWVPDTVTKEDKVVKWQLPVEVDGISGEYYVQFPDDLMEAADIKENDFVEWVDQGDGSYLLKKVDVHT